MTRNERAPVCESSAGIAPVAGPLTARMQMVLGACACAGAAAFLFAVDPSRHGVYPVCPLYQATGVYCVGCGATRAAYALLHGHFLAALHDNVLFVAALPLLAWMLFPRLAQAWRENRWPGVPAPDRVSTRVLLALGMVALGFMLLRNLPGWPFELLRPV